MRRMWLLLLVVPVLAGCGQQAPPAAASAPGTVEVNTTCAGIEQAYWQGSWWVGFVDARERFVGEGPVRELDGTMTTTAPGTADLVSTRQNGSLRMSDTPDTRPGLPPYACALDAPA